MNDEAFVGIVVVIGIVFLPLFLLLRGATLGRAPVIKQGESSAKYSAPKMHTEGHRIDWEVGEWVDYLDGKTTSMTAGSWEKQATLEPLARNEIANRHGGGWFMG